MQLESLHTQQARLQQYIWHVDLIAHQQQDQVKSCFVETRTTAQHHRGETLPCFWTSGNIHMCIAYTVKACADMHT